MVDPRAHDAYVRGRQATSASEAIPHLEEAVVLDPDFALAWGKLAEQYAVLGVRGGADTLTARESRRSASGTDRSSG